jgi:hypothetical protein
MHIPQGCTEKGTIEGMVITDCRQVFSHENSVGIEHRYVKSVQAGNGGIVAVPGRLLHSRVEDVEGNGSEGDRVLLGVRGN